MTSQELNYREEIPMNDQDIFKSIITTLVLNEHTRVSQCVRFGSIYW